MAKRRKRLYRSFENRDAFNNIPSTAYSECCKYKAVFLESEIIARNKDTITSLVCIHCGNRDYYNFKFLD